MVYCFQRADPPLTKQEPFIKSYSNFSSSRSPSFCLYVQSSYQVGVCLVHIGLIDHSRSSKLYWAESRAASFRLRLTVMRSILTALLSMMPDLAWCFGLLCTVPNEQGRGLIGNDQGWQWKPSLFALQRPTFYSCQLDKQIIHMWVSFFNHPSQGKR